MVRLRVQSVARSSQEEVWLRVLHYTDTLADPALNRSWIVILGLQISQDEGVNLAQALEQAFQTDPAPDSLNTACHSLLDIHEGDVMAVCIEGSRATFISRGRCQAKLWRQQKSGSIVTTHDSWEILTGPLYPHDKWWLAVGDIEEVDSGLQATLDSQIVEGDAESIQALIDQNRLLAAGVCVDIELSEAPMVAEVVPAAAPAGKTEPAHLKRQRVMVLGLLVLALLVVSVWFGAKTRQERLMAASFSQLQQQVAAAMAAAEAGQSVDQIKARQDLRDLMDLVDQAKNTYEQDKVYAARWSELSTQVTQTYNRFAGEADVAELPVWFDLSVVRSGFQGHRLTAGDENLMVLDTGLSTVVKIGLSSKRADVVVGGDAIAGAVDLATANKRVFVLTAGGVVEAAANRAGASSLISKDDGWQQASLLTVFNNNVYIVDPAAGEIWRYPAITGGVGAKQRWLGQGVTLTANDAVGVAVDGDLWVLRSSGLIARYRRGAPVTFTFSGLDAPIGSATPAIAVSPEQDALVVVDQSNQRVVRFTKEGSYVKQVKWSGFAAAQAIALSPDAATLYILAHGKIYTTPI